MTKRTLLLVATILSSSFIGCGGGGSNDMAVPTPDFSGAPAGSDLSTPPILDLAANPQSFMVSWKLFDDMDSNQYVTCNDPRAALTGLVFSVRNQTSMTTSTTMAPCPAGTSFGDATLSTPDSTGPFTINATTAGNVTSASQDYMDITPTTNLSISIYLFKRD